MLNCPRGAIICGDDNRDYHHNNKHDLAKSFTQRELEQCKRKCRQSTYQTEYNKEENLPYELVGVECRINQQEPGKRVENKRTDEQDGGQDGLPPVLGNVVCP